MSYRNTVNATRGIARASSHKGYEIILLKHCHDCFECSYTCHKMSPTYRSENHQKGQTREVTIRVVSQNALREGNQCFLEKLVGKILMHSYLPCT